MLPDILGHLVRELGPGVVHGQDDRPELEDRVEVALDQGDVAKELAFTGRAEDVIERARREAAIGDQPQVGTEHILLALVRDQDGAAARILLLLDADPAAIRAALAS